MPKDYSHALMNRRRAPARLAAVVLWVLVIAGLASAFTFVPADALARWRFDRDAVLSHAQAWRLVTGGLAHLNAAHLFANVLGFVLVWAVFVRQASAGRQAALLGALVPLTWLAMLVLFPRVMWGAGLSGPLHALFAWQAWRLMLCTRSARVERSFGAVLLAGAAAKVAFEAHADPAQGPAWLGARVLWESHAAGLAVGACAALLVTLVDRARAGAQARDA